MDQRAVMGSLRSLEAESTHIDLLCLLVKAFPRQLHGRPGISQGPNSPWQQSQEGSVTFVPKHPIDSSEPFRSVDVAELFKLAAPCIANHRSGQYAQVTEAYVLGLTRYLRSEVLTTFQKSPISRRDLLAIGGHTQSRQSGIYLHMLWTADMAKHGCFVYIGQSTDLCLRIRAHESPFYRAKNVTLHYYMWDSQPGLQSAFTILAEAPSIPAIDLNILELCACLLFQSLPQHEVKKYTPSWICRAARGLNIANPLWQGTPGTNEENPSQILSKTEHFTGLIREANPIRKQYLLDASFSFSELRTSPNETLRKYFQELCWRRQAVGSKTKTSRTLESLLQGCEKTVRTYGYSTSLVVLGSINLRVLRSDVKFKDSDTIFVQGFVSDPPLPGWYAADAEPSDPARKLRIWMQGVDEDGKPFAKFMHAGGDQMVQDINTLVDQLDGASHDEIASRPRRRVPSSVAKGRRLRKAYT